MATKTETTATPTPAPGEIKLGTPKGGLVTIDPELISKIHAQAGSTPPEPPPEPTKKENEPAAPPATNEPKPPAKPADTPAPAGNTPPPVPEKTDKPEPVTTAKTPKQLREAYEAAQARLDELERKGNATHEELAKAHAKVGELESKYNTAHERVTKELEPLRAQFEETNKKLQEREEALRIRDYTATTEWHERYVKPIVEVQEEASQLLGELVVSVEGKEVAASVEHLNFVIGAQNAMEAHRRAEQLFGPFANKIVDYRTKLRALQKRQQEALNNAALESAEWQKRTQSQQLEAQSKFKSAVEQRVRAHIAQITETDAEEVAAFNEGQKLSDLLESGDPKMAVDDVAETVAKAKGRITSYPVLELRNKRLSARVSELEAKLKEYETSEPAVQPRTTGEPAETTDEGGDITTRLKKQLMGKIVAAGSR